MATLDERTFDAMYNSAPKLEGEDMLDSFIRIITEHALKSGEIKNSEELDAFIDAGFQERHIAPSTKDVERIKNNIICARIQDLTRDITDIGRSSKKDDENAKKRYNGTMRELMAIRNNPNSYFENLFAKGKERK